MTLCLGGWEPRHGPWSRGAPQGLGSQRPTGAVVQGPRKEVQLGVQPRGGGGPRTSGLDQQDKHDGMQALGGGLAETQGVTRGWPRGAGFPGLWSTEAICVWEAEAAVSSLPATLVRMMRKRH